RNTDIDMFGFTTGAGTITINIKPAPNGPDLDVLAKLYNSAGAGLAKSNPTGVFAASFNLTVPARTYYLSGQGTGQGDPLSSHVNYASLGAYTISGTVAGTASNVPPIASISATPLSGNAPLTVQFDGNRSYDSDGTISSFAWTFGDGATGTGSSVSHT